MKNFIEIKRMLRIHGLIFSRERVVFFLLVFLFIFFVIILGFGVVTVFRYQRFVGQPSLGGVSRLREFREDRLKKTLEIIDAREEREKRLFGGEF